MKRILVTVCLVVAAFALGYLMRGEVRRSSDASSAVAAGEETATEWTCSMHPQIRQPKPGLCPLCAMDLIPVDTGAGEETGSRALKLSPLAQQLAQVQTAPVERMFATAEIRMVGKVDFDETRLRYITAWVGGRLDRLYVDYTGVPVQQGDHLVSIYSPELIAAQQELLTALKAAGELERSGVGGMRAGALRTAEAVREKLRRWGLLPAQIEELEQRGAVSDQLTIYAPISGIVIEKEAVQGMYVETGMRIYTIADLSRVWVMLEAYESDLAWLRYGQEVSFTTEAYPGRTFSGRIAFIDPVLNAATRTVRVRVNVDNADGRLKPEMFVRAVVYARVAAGGKVADAALAGKWISPMHPEIVKDHPGACDVCGMPLVRAESLGYVSDEDAAAQAPLVIPDTAPLLTGKRAVVYVLTDAATATYEGRDVVLGPRAGKHYIVESGLAEGERVVTYGNFKLDGEIQLRGKISMMHPDAEVRAEHAPPPVESLVVPQAVQAGIDGVLSAYFALGRALSGDDAGGAQQAARKVADAVSAVPTDALSGEAADFWNKERVDLAKSAETIALATSIEAARAAFVLLSDGLAIVARRMAGPTRPVRVFHCPMAFNDRGADWLQETEDVENPYFGAVMYRCGYETDVIVPDAAE